MSVVALLGLCPFEALTVSVFEPFGPLTFCLSMLADSFFIFSVLGAFRFTLVNLVLTFIFGILAFAFFLAFATFWAEVKTKFCVGNVP